MRPTMCTASRRRWRVRLRLLGCEKASSLPHHRAHIWDSYTRPRSVLSCREEGWALAGITTLHFGGGLDGHRHRQTIWCFHQTPSSKAPWTVSLIRTSVSLANPPVLRSVHCAIQVRLTTACSPVADSELHSSFKRDALSHSRADTQTQFPRKLFPGHSLSMSLLPS